jgi:GTP-binding protein
MIVDQLFDAPETDLEDTEEFEDSEESTDQKKEPAVRAPRIPHIAIVGQPNVGKSTLLNAICGEKRTIVSPIAGTTVDPIDLKINWHGKDFVVIDTAGIRRKNKTEQGVEVLSVVQSRKTLERADLAFLIMDGETGVYDQDEKIAGLIEEMGCSVVLVLNKWDTQVNNDEFSQKLAEEEIRKKIRFLGYAPLVFTTATEGIGLERLFRVADHVLEQRSVHVSTKDLTDFIRAETEVHNPENAKFYFVHQSGRNPPTFVAHVSDPKKVHFSLSRHLVRAIRERYGFSGSPIRFHFLKTRNTGEKK